MEKIKLNIEDKSYMLGYNRKQALAMERAGFKVGSAQDLPATMIPMLYQGAFKTYQAYLKNEKIDELWCKVKGKAKLIEKLVELYVATITVDLQDDEDYREGNENWEVVE